jgi:hypothetical protein
MKWSYQQTEQHLTPVLILWKKLQSTFVRLYGDEQRSNPIIRQYLKNHSHRLTLFVGSKRASEQRPSIS